MWRTWRTVEKGLWCSSKKGSQNEATEKKEAAMESMGGGRSKGCKTPCCPLTRKYENTMRVGIYRTGAGATTACEGEVAKETM